MSSSRDLRKLETVNYQIPDDPELTPAEKLAQQFIEEDNEDKDGSFHEEEDQEFDDDDEEADVSIFAPKRKKVKKSKKLKIPSLQKVPGFHTPYRKAPGPSLPSKVAASTSRERSPLRTSLPASPPGRSFSPSRRERSPSPSNRRRRSLTPPPASPLGRSFSPTKRRKSPRSSTGPPLRYSPNSKTLHGLTPPPSSSAAPVGGSQKKFAKTEKEIRDSSNWIKIVQLVVYRMKATKQPLQGVKFKKIYDDLLEAKAINTDGWSKHAVKDKARYTKVKVSNKCEPSHMPSKLLVSALFAFLTCYFLHKLSLETNNLHFRKAFRSLGSLL